VAVGASALHRCPRSEDDHRSAFLYGLGLAAETGASPRTLQRRLTERSISFSRLVTEARVEVAATHLCKANGPGLAEIGFIAGFADQAHFARTFSRAVGTTPSGYRADFGQ
jgi:AraC-like DNA-binding protein